MHFKSIFLVFILGTAVQAAPAAFTLKQAIEYGIQHSPRMESSLASRESAKLDLANAEARYLPRLEADASAGMRYVTSPQFGDSGPNDDRSAGLSITQNLWDGGIRSLARDAAQTRLKAAELDYVRNRDDLVLDIVKAFYDLSEATLAIQSNTEQKRMLERQSHDIDVAFRQGLRLKRDAVRMQTEIQRQEIAVIGSTDQASRAKERLLTLMGAASQLGDASTNSNTGAVERFEFQTFLPQETSAFTAILVGKETRLDVQNTTLAKRQKLDAEASNYALEGERRRRTWPSIDFNLGSNYRVNDSGGRDLPRTFTRDGVNWYASLGVRYTIWDWGIREREIASLVNEQKKATADRSLAIGEMQQKMADVKRVLTQSEKNLKLNSDLLKLEEEANAALVSDFKQGRVSYLEVVDATQKLRDAKLAHAKAYFDWQRSAWDFKYYAGGLFDVVQSL